MQFAKIKQTVQKPLFLPGFELAAKALKRVATGLDTGIKPTSCRIGVKSERSELVTDSRSKC